MLKYIMPLVLLFGFTACELNEEDILKSIVGDAAEVPEGSYESQCVQNVDGLTSSKFSIELSADSYTIQEDTYTDTACTAGESIGTASAALNADLPGPNLGEGFSFFTDDDGKKVPYFYGDKDGETVFVLGEPQDSLPNGDDDFSGFQADLEAGRVAIYQRVN